jgi:hypothetical protein
MQPVHLFLLRDRILPFLDSYTRRARFLIAPALPRAPTTRPSSPPTSPTIRRTARKISFASLGSVLATAREAATPPIIAAIIARAR